MPLPDPVRGPLPSWMDHTSTGGGALRTYTTKEAASVAGYAPEGFRAMMTKQRNRGGPDWRVPGPDTRTPLWDADAIDSWAAQLPSNGPARAGRPKTPAWGVACVLPYCQGHPTIRDASEHASQLTEAADQLWRSIQATTSE